MEAGGKLINGVAFARQLRSEIRQEAENLHAVHGILPTLAVVMVGVAGRMIWNRQPYNLEP